MTSPLGAILFGAVFGRVSFLEVLPLLVVISPLIGVTTSIVMSRWNVTLVRPMALSNCAMTLLLSSMAVWMLPPISAEPDSKPRSSVEIGIPWLAETQIEPGQTAARLNGVRVLVGLASDGLSAWSGLLVSLLVWAVLCSLWRLDHQAFAFHCIWIMACQSLLLASFFATDAVTATVFVEMALLPVYLLVGKSGETGRRPAASAWWMWQMVGCSSWLIGITLLAVAQTWMHPDAESSPGPLILRTSLLTEGLQQWLARGHGGAPLPGGLSVVSDWGAALLLFGLFIRLPVFPFQGWYLTASLAAPPAVSALVVTAFPLAALNGWLRLGAPLFGLDGSVIAILGTASILGVLQSSFALLAENDLKRMLTTISCTVLGMAAMGLCFQSREAPFAAWLLVLCQGLAVAGGLLCVPMIESRFGTRDLTKLSGLTRHSPRLAVMVSLLLLGWATVPCVCIFPAIFMQMSAAPATGFWLLISESIALAAIAFAAIRALSLLIPSRSAEATAVAASVDGADLTGPELATLFPILALLVLVNCVPMLITSRVALW